MHRLLQGEVGTGKTVVALRAMLTVVDSGGQAVLLAPTEVLAQQHHRSLTELLGPLAERGLLGGSDAGTRVALLTGSLGAPARREALLQAPPVRSGDHRRYARVAGGPGQFADLGLVVVDEQHRFGVEQRAALASKGPGDTRPHVLVMTATPIPRTVAMTVFGDLWVSTLSELPAGRADVDDARRPGRREATLPGPRLAAGPGGGRQGSPGLHRLSAHRRRCAGAGREARDGDTGRPADRGPRRGRDAAHRSARGTGGRGSARPPDAGGKGPRHAAVQHSGMRRSWWPRPSSRSGSTWRPRPRWSSWTPTGSASRSCTSFAAGSGGARCPASAYWSPRSPRGSPARGRLAAVAATRDGFTLARVDLEQRREGDVLGAAQSGRRSSLRLLSVIHDENLILAAREAASLYVADDPELRRWLPLADAVSELAGDERADYLEKA